MERFIVTLRHDDGTVRIATTARDAETAERIVLQAEGAPPSAVLSVREAPCEHLVADDRCTHYS